MNVTIYGKPGCTNCDKSKLLCDMKGVSYNYKTIGQDITLEQLNEMIGCSVKTVPQIFITSDGFTEYVGGYEQLKSKI